MRTRRDRSRGATGPAARVAWTIVAAGALVAAGCGASTSDAEESRPPPVTAAPTTTTAADPGPNPTLGGPRTVVGTVRVDVQVGCVGLDTSEAETLELLVAEHSLTEVAGVPVLVTGDGRPVAVEGNEMIVAGFPRRGVGACGDRFEVDSVVSVRAEPSG